MTTEVIVKANHGWPVEVMQMPTGGDQPGWVQRVAPGETRSFSVHSGADLRIHEVQPGEIQPGVADPQVRHPGLPVAGYKAQGADAVARVNGHKADEERLLRKLDALAEDPAIDKRWLAIGRTALEQGFMAINRAVFRPGRVDLAD